MKKIIKYMWIAFAILVVSSCGNKPTKGEENETEHHDEHENSNTATLTKEQINSIKLEYGGIEKKQLTASLKANGILKVPNQNKASATTLMGGIVKSIYVQSGTSVRKGQILATIANNSIITMQEDYLSVSSKLVYAQSEYNRQKELKEGNATALKNFQAAEAEYKSLQARKASLQRQLEQIGINPASLSNENIQSTLSVLSPISGAISDVKVNIGSYIESNSSIVEIVDNSQLHLDLYVYEKDLNKLKVGQTIHFTLTNNPGKEYDADVYAISNTFEQNTKAVAVHATVKGNKQGLIDGMSITALVSLENATVDAVPTSAIVNHDGQDYIFIVTDKHSEEEHGAGSEHVENEDEHGHKHKESKEAKEDVESVTFERIPVRKGTTDVGYSEITLLKDIPANAKIVVNGAFFILAKMINQGEAHEH